MVTALPGWAWAAAAALCGYAAGLLHAAIARRRRGRAFCPRCLHYLNWRETLMREVRGAGRTNLSTRDPW